MGVLRSILPIATFLSCAVIIHGETRIAVANLISQNVTGAVFFTETDNGIRVHGAITGMRPGLYGFHVHEFGDTSTCDATGPHFDPEEKSHGGRDHDVRHVGDFGNVQFVGNDQEPAVAYFDFVDTLITLRGRNSILGRGLVLHEGEDDLGLGGHDMSLITGNAGPRIACGTIGIHSGYWNSGISTYSSLTLVIFGLVFFFLNEFYSTH